MEALQAGLLRLVLAGFRALGPVRASDFGGWLARVIGPLLPVSRVADANLRAALPALDAGARARVVRGVWDNLGRTCAELPHLPRLRRSEVGPGWEIAGFEHVRGAVEDGAQVLFVSGHLGNWELLMPIAQQLGVRVAGVYRAPSNVAVRALLAGMRDAATGGGVPLFPKGATGARGALRFMEGGGSLALLMDQKLNDGIAVPFFGRMAMTAPAAAQFALRFGVPVIPVRMVRLGPARLRMVCEAPLQVVRTGDRGADAYAMTVAINGVLEQWIREAPGSWLWLHRRWPKG